MYNCLLTVSICLKSKCELGGSMLTFLQDWNQCALPCFLDFSVEAQTLVVGKIHLFTLVGILEFCFIKACNMHVDTRWVSKENGVLRNVITGVVYLCQYCLLVKSKSQIFLTGIHKTINDKTLYHEGHYLLHQTHHLLAFCAFSIYLLIPVFF